MRQRRGGPLSPELILRLQATAGNRAVQHLIERYRAPVLAIVPAEPVALEESYEEIEVPEPSWWQRRLSWIRSNNAPWGEM